MSSPRVPLIFGTMTIGEPGKNGVRNESSEAQEVLDIFFDAGFTALDTARGYGEGTTEKVSPEGLATATRVEQLVFPGALRIKPPQCYSRHQSGSPSTGRSLPGETSCYLQSISRHSQAQKGPHILSACTRPGDPFRGYSEGS
jgi:Aldo/keto reductase family